MKKLVIMVLVALSVASSAAIAAKGDQPFGGQVFFGEGSFTPNQPNSVPNSQVDLDFNLGGIASWDADNDPDNVIENCVSGDSITGFGWDLTIETVGASWLSEAVMRYSNSDGDADPNWITLTVGIGNDAPGNMNFTSGGILDLTDNALPDIVSNPDGLFMIQFFESFDDVADDIDANYLSGSVNVAGINLVGTPGPGCTLIGLPPLPVPADNNFALIALLLSVMGLGFVAFRRFA
jgi:hypothetical protein